LDYTGGLTNNSTRKIQGSEQFGDATGGGGGVTANTRYGKGQGDRYLKETVLGGEKRRAGILGQKGKHRLPISSEGWFSLSRPKQ